MKNIYSKKIELGIYYTYDLKRKKIYDLKSLQEDFNLIVKKLKS
tara:strand:+ start:429 stop:560 length:132 start_codon:yes stop_codon:yes gene_type:complete